jgi:hypothetical protein
MVGRCGIGGVGFKAGMMLACACSATCIAQEVEKAPASSEAKLRLTQAAYTQADTSWWTFGAGTSSDFDELSDINATAAYSYFVDDGIEVSAELALREFDQPGDDVWGVNPAIIFRWHFYRSEDNDLTAFADVGIGAMISDDDVPQNGTSLNFTPRAGLGITKAISDQWRFQIGARWSHVSNGRIFGSDDNPASDGIMLFVGFTTTF